jgi:hypothetical protein
MRQISRSRIDIWLHAFRQEFVMKPPARPELPVVAPENAEDREYLALMFQEHAEHARQHEVLRAAATGFFMALIAGLLAFAVGETSNHGRVWVAGILVCAVSVLGALLNYKHYERYRRHTTIRRGYRASLEAGITPALKTIQANCRAAHKIRFPFTSENMRLHSLWVVVYAVAFFVGVAVIVVGIVSR